MIKFSHSGFSPYSIFMSLFYFITGQAKKRKQRKEAQGLAEKVKSD